jgi:hypothetical protein
MKTLKLFLAILTISTLLSSCYVSHTTIGSGPVGNDRNTVNYSSTKQLYLFWGLVPIGQKQADVPKDGNCQVKTSLKVVDAIVYTLTGGILSMQTIQVITKK